MFSKSKKQQPAGTPKTKSKKRSYIVSFTLVFVLTVISLLYSFYNAGEGNIVSGFLSVGEALQDCDIIWLLVIAALMIVSFLADGLIIYVFCRLYTRHYYYHQGVCNAVIGSFYNNVTPSSTGGQIMQVYTLKKQGIEVSNAASIMVMWFILYQVALIILDVAALLFEWNIISSIKSLQIPNFSLFGWNGEIPMLPLIILGFLINVSIIGILYLMSFSHTIHNFILHRIIGFLGKIKLIRNPDKTRENLRVSVENFKIELRRLQSNVPITILVILLFLVILLIRFSMPYFSGLALHAYGGDSAFSFTKMMDGCFRSAFHQMVTGFIPIPGAAGVSELFYTAMFNEFFVETQAVVDGSLILVRSANANMMATQILWRISTYYLVLIISGLVASLYHSRPKESFIYANRQTFVDLQIQTYEARKQSSDTIYQTKQLSRKEIRSHIFSLGTSKSELLYTGDDYLGFDRMSRKKTVENGSKESKEAIAKKKNSIFDEGDDE